MRLIAGEGYLSHTNPLFYHLKIPKLNDIRLYLLAIYGFKINRDGLLSYRAHSYDTIIIRVVDGGLFRRSRMSPDLATHWILLYLRFGTLYLATLKVEQH